MPSSNLSQKILSVGRQVRLAYARLLVQLGLSPYRKRQPKNILTAEQRECWEQNGYLVLPGFVNSEKLLALNALVDQVWNERKRPENRLIIDMFIGTPNERRAYFREAPEEARAVPYKLNDLFLESDLVRNLILDQTLSAVLDQLLDGEPIVCNSLTFERGSQQREHFDTFYMPPYVRNKMVASWIGLEDVHPEAGPLTYWPGTHKIPPYIFSNGKTTATYDELPRFYDYIRREMEARGITQVQHAGKAGDVFIWHAQLLHGGEPIRNPALTRRSIVTHYFRACDVDPLLVRTISEGRHYLDRPHQKVA